MGAPEKEKPHHDAGAAPDSIEDADDLNNAGVIIGAIMIVAALVAVLSILLFPDWAAMQIHPDTNLTWGVGIIVGFQIAVLFSTSIFLALLTREPSGPNTSKGALDQ